MKKFLIAALLIGLSAMNCDLAHVEAANGMPVIEASNGDVQLEEFKNTVRKYREHGAVKVAIDYCQATIKSKPSDKDVSIEAYYQLADIYHNDFNVPFRVNKFTNKAIALVKNKYSKKEIEEFVNGEDALNGKTNTVREIYILKSEIENVKPESDPPRYRTDW